MINETELVTARDYEVWNELAVSYLDQLKKLRLTACALDFVCRSLMHTEIGKVSTFMAHDEDIRKIELMGESFKSKITRLNGELQ